ncbi:helix-turn-helix transcriptional regulator [Brevundimonas lutea]|uniref:helix-turn-helix transcriptional regulator n=1 Tax=Brevundimonas lutea TaxID=2293980 RepID=UPI000F030279|nr:helix-turn-helix transcriptional regulator [Brevundimonas lutea]
MSFGSTGLSDRLDDTLDTVDAAALGLEAWSTALAKLRDLTGSRVGQLSAIGATAASFGWCTGQESPQERLEAGVADLRINSRRRASLSAPVMAILDEAHFDTEADVRRHPAYGEFLRRHDYPYICLSPVVRSPEVTINLSVTRGAAQGGLDADGKRLFAAVAHRVRHALRVQQTLEQRALDLVVATLGRMSGAVLACRRDGRILSCTSEADTLLATGDRLVSRCGRLTSPSRKAAQWLSGAIAAASDAHAASPVPSRLIRDSDGERPLVIEIQRLPNIAAGAWGADTVLVLARDLDPARSASRAAFLGGATMAFTRAEEAVARDLLSGCSPSETAERLGIAVGTVRVHIRNIYAKAGVRNQLAFAALMGALR